MCILYEEQDLDITTLPYTENIFKSEENNTFFYDIEYDYCTLYIIYIIIHA